MLAAIMGNGFPFTPRFSAPPYDLARFDSIATFKAGRYGRAKDFSLGYLDRDSAGNERHVVAAYRCASSGGIALARIDGVLEGSRLQVTTSGGVADGKWTSSKDPATPVTFKAKYEHDQAVQFSLLRALQTTLPRKGKESPDLGEFLLVTSQMHLGYDGISCAPIRSKPKRTYDLPVEEYDPEGDHIPSVLAKALADVGPSPDVDALRRALEEFGSESGLFSRVNVKRLGATIGDPFQLRVSVGGPAVNIVDVGYGVSQSLPIVVLGAMSRRRTALLLQQPEVHLHPRAQAALGSLFARLSSRLKDRVFVIETHSDHLVDRVRQEVAVGTVAPEMVSILFFHRERLETTIHTLDLDRFGNVLNPPPEYRAFFLDEEENLLNRTSKI